MLTAEESASVAAARSRRNLENCQAGIYAKCDLSILTAPEIAAITAAEKQRAGRGK